MQAVILTAGEGKRLGLGIPKILIEIDKEKTLLEHHLAGLKELGIEEIIIVGGYECDLIKKTIQLKKLDKLYKLFVVCVDWKDKGNAFSLYQAKSFVKETFLLLMGDLFFEYSMLKEFVCLRPVVVVVDSQPKVSITKNTTKVKIKDNKITQIQKGELAEFDAVEFGIALADTRVFQQKIAPQSDWIDVLKKIIDKDKISVFDVKGAFWKNINYLKDLEEVRRYVNENNS